ncbi:immunoglobulin-like domain-containing protein [Arcobacter roscoffensis]|uniref:immunoglobulin-like domain-containing protein n=1 Tax=Arcobacter roscoffensis TaxID=2961520 RepID=UPI003D1C2BEA
MEGESATYKVTLTDDAGQPVVTTEDLTVDFTYTYTTAEGEDITETVEVTIPKGSSEAPVEVATKDDVYTEGTEEFDIALNAVTAGKDQFENVTVDDTAVTTSITDESDPYNPNDPDTPNEKDNVNVKLVGVDTDVTEVRVQHIK